MPGKRKTAASERAGCQRRNREEEFAEDQTIGGSASTM